MNDKLLTETQKHGEVFGGGACGKIAKILGEVKYSEHDGTSAYHRPSITNQSIKYFPYGAVSCYTPLRRYGEKHGRQHRFPELGARNAGSNKDASS